jgi:hypothetical protein
MKDLEGTEFQLHSSLTLMLVGCCCLASHSGCFIFGETPSNTYLTGGIVAAGAAWIVLDKSSTYYLSRGSNRYFLVVQPLA